MNNPCAGCGFCGSCASCGRELALTRTELELLNQLAQTPFLPAAGDPDSEVPVYLEAGAQAARDYGLAVLGLQQKGLVQVDYDMPLPNFDYQAYGRALRKGSMALTARGQTVLELLEIQGIEE